MRLKVVTHKEKKELVYVECYQDFVDVLFSFLLIPMGGVIRSLQKDNPNTTEIGCLNNLLKSAGSLFESHYRTLACASMLRNPQRACKQMFGELKSSFGDLDSGLYLCERFTPECMLRFSNRVDCPCGAVCQDSLAYIENDVATTTVNDGVFVKGALAERYLITDDLQVMPASISNCMSMIEKHGIKDTIETSNKSFGRFYDSSEVQFLLWRSLSSKTPLTDTLLDPRNMTLKKVQITENVTYQNLKTNLSTGSPGKKFRVKLYLERSTNKVLYAEADHEFVDQLFSFLTFPLGTIANLFGGGINLMGCIDNIYQSVKDLDTEGCMISEQSKSSLISPKVAPHYGCDSQLLSVKEDVYPKFNICSQREFEKEKYVLTEEYGNAASDGRKCVRVMNPKSLVPTDKSGGGFVKGPAKFMVTDDLVVKPFCNTSCLLFLNEMNVALNEIVERVVDVGESEVLKLLKASLISASALCTLLEAGNA